MSASSSTSTEPVAEDSGAPTATSTTGPAVSLETAGNPPTTRPDGSPVIEQDSAAGLTEGDPSTELEQSGIAPEVVWLFPSPDNPEDCEGAECRPPPRCLIGIERCPGDITFNTTRTFWTQNSVN